MVMRDLYETISVIFSYFNSVIKCECNTLQLQGRITKIGRIKFGSSFSKTCVSDLTFDDLTTDFD